MKEKIDYSTIADRIVEQVVEHSRFVLRKDEKQKLFQSKIDQARQEIEDRATCPIWHTDR